MQQSATWIAAHSPKGSSSSGSTQGTTGSVVTSIGFGYDDNQHSNAWQDAALDIGVAPGGAHASYWRADGVASWTVPIPATAPTGGKRLTVTVACGCPTSDRGATNVPPGTRRSLLPIETPTAGLICSYNALNGAAFYAPLPRPAGQCPGRAPGTPGECDRPDPHLRRCHQLPYGRRGNLRDRVPIPRRRDESYRKAGSSRGTGSTDGVAGLDEHFGGLSVVGALMGT